VEGAAAEQEEEEEVLVGKEGEEAVAVIARISGANLLAAGALRAAASWAGTGTRLVGTT